MNYNKLNSCSIKELKVELKKQNRNIVIIVVGLIILLSFILFRFYETGTINWVILIPLSLVVLMWNARKYKRDILNAIMVRNK